MKQPNVWVGFGIFLCGLFPGGLPANPATAALVTFTFTGTVTSAGSNHAASAFAGGSPISLSGPYTFNSGVPNGSDARLSVYPGTMSNMRFQVGTHNGVDGVSGPQVMLRTNNVPFAGDKYTSSSPEASVSTNGTPVAFEFARTRSTGAFSNTSLPTTPPSLGSFASAPTYRVNFTGGLQSIARGTMDSLTAVPLPVVVVLFGLGFIALVGLGAGSWQQRKNLFS
ncbi:MAG: hypothetical protein ABIU05_00445 [Nitrospirales bacterium]